MLILPHYFLFPAGVLLGVWGLPHDSDTLSCHSICSGQTVQMLCNYRSDGSSWPSAEYAEVSDASQKVTSLQQSRTYIGD